MSAQTQTILDKYGEIIAEEVNVKSVTVLSDDVIVTANYVPLWQKLWWSFWKDTARIIAAAKAWNASRHQDWTLVVTDWSDQRVLAPEMYETRRTGLQEDHQTVEWGVIVSLDLTITEDLKKEWVAREISRFLNQMRKDAQFMIDDRVFCYRESTDKELEEVVREFTDFLCEEALLKSIERNSSVQWFSATFTSEEWTLVFTLVQ